jgi:hypothetical protein
MGYPGDLNQTAASIHAWPRQKVVISRLLNSTHYYISTCFIMKTIANGVSYRLLIIHDSVLADRNYPTLRGAKIAFKKQFKHLTWSDDLPAEWSPFYTPDQEWIEAMLSTAGKSQ